MPARAFQHASGQRHGVHDSPASESLWPQLAEDRLQASVIADLQHVPPDLLNVILRVKGPRGIILVSDSVLLAGMKPGQYSLFGGEVEMKRNGRICLAGTDLLAGSSLLLPEAVFNTARVTDMSLAAAFAAASRNPARLLGVPLPSWPPRPGRPAEFVLYRGLTHRARESETAARLHRIREIDRHDRQHRTSHIAGRHQRHRFCRRLYGARVRDDPHKNNVSIELAGITSGHLGNAQQFASRHGVGAAFEYHRDMLDVVRPHIDCIACATMPTHSTSWKPPSRACP